jgi:hypothetical protein
MTKDEILGAMHNALNNFVLGNVYAKIVPDTAWTGIREAFRFVGPNRSLDVPLEPLADNMTTPRDKAIMVEEFCKSLRRSLMRDGHELIDWYCNETHQYAKYQAVPWWNFARIMRNVVSHKLHGRLNEWPGSLLKKGILRVEWRDRFLESSMVGQDIQFSNQEALELFRDQMDFVRTGLD